MSLSLKNTVTSGADKIQSDFSLKDALPVYGSLVFQPTLSASDPFFTTSITVPVGSFSQGTWVRVSGLSDGILNGVSTLSDSLIVPVSGTYEVSLSGGVAEQTDGNNRTMGFSFSINNASPSIPVGSLDFYGGNFGISNGRPLPFDGSKIFNLNALDKVGLYFIGVRDSGTASVDFIASYINFSIKRLGGSFVTGEV